jgi:hypothetical protein
MDAVARALGGRLDLVASFGDHTVTVPQPTRRKDSCDARPSRMPGVSYREGQPATAGWAV